MPLPTPKDDETQSEFVARATPVALEDKSYTSDEQRTAAVLSEFRAAAKSVKILDAARGIIGGWGIPFGGPVQGGKDLDGEWFTKDTNFCLDWFPDDGRPVLYGHGTDPDVKLDVIGRQTTKSVDEKMGIWVETQLNMAHKYAELILSLAKKGVLGYSSGALGGYVQRQKNGFIKQWPWIEQSLTPIPSNPYALIPADAVKHFAGLGLDLPEVLREAKELVLPNGMSVNDLRDKLETAIKELPGSDKNHCWVTDVREGLVVANGGSGYVRYAFKMETDGEVQITSEGENVQRHEAWVPEETKALEELASKLEEDGWTKAGRTMSARNMSQLHEGYKALTGLHESTCDMNDDCPTRGSTKHDDTENGELDEGGRDKEYPDLETPERLVQRAEIDRLLEGVTLEAQ